VSGGRQIVAARNKERHSLSYFTRISNGPPSASSKEQKSTLDSYGDTMIDPKMLMMLAVGALLFLNGVIGARA
jgi:hypothetical protein